MKTKWKIGGGGGGGEEGEEFKGRCFFGLSTNL